MQLSYNKVDTKLQQKDKIKIMYKQLIDNIENMLWDNYYRTEVLRGYCENLEGEYIGSVMLENLLSDITGSQKKMLEIIDKETSRIARMEFFTEDNI